MAGTATATYSADVWTSPGSVDASQQPWDFAVPARQNVSGLHLLSVFSGLDGVGAASHLTCHQSAGTMADYFSDRVTLVPSHGLVTLATEDPETRAPEARPYPDMPTHKRQTS
jgi:hypothetical protein